MSLLVKQSESTAARRKVRVRVLEYGGSPVTGLTLTSAWRWLKADGSTAAAAGALAEIDATNDAGAYTYQATAGEVDTLGAGGLSRVDDTNGYVLLGGDVQVVAFDPYVATPTNWNLMSVNADGRVDVIKIAGTTQTPRDLGANLDVAVGSRMESFTYTAPLDAAGVRSAVGLASANLDTQLGTIDDFLDTEVAAIKAKTDNLPSDPADASDIATAFGTVNTTLGTIAGYIDTEVAAIKAKTDLIPASPASSAEVSALTQPRLITASEIAEDATDVLTFKLPTAGLTATDVKLRKFGGAYSASLVRTVTPVGNGEYTLAAIAADRNTPGENRWAITMSDASVWHVTEMVRADTRDAIAEAVDDLLEPRFALINARLVEDVGVSGAILYAAYSVAGETLYAIFRRGANAAVEATGEPDAYDDNDRETFAFTFTDRGTDHHDVDLSDLSYGVWTAMVYTRVTADDPDTTDRLVGSVAFNWNGSATAGATNFTVNVTDTADDSDVANVEVVATGTAFSATAITDASGNARFSLRAGTYTFTVAPVGYTGTSGTATVPTDTTEPLTVTLNPPFAATSDGTITGYLLYKDNEGEATAGQTYYVKLVTAPPGSDGLDYDYDPVAYVTSDGTDIYTPTGVTIPEGYIYVLHRRGGVYRCYTLDGDGNPTSGVEYTALTDTALTSFAIEEGVGQGCQD